jgi:hypothetical protein
VEDTLGQIKAYRGNVHGGRLLFRRVIPRRPHFGT